MLLFTVSMGELSYLVRRRFVKPLYKPCISFVYALYKLFSKLFSKLRLSYALCELCVKAAPQLRVRSRTYSVC